MKNEVRTELAPGAIGPYSQGVIYDQFIFTSGQLPLDPITMNFTGSGIREQTLQCLKNLEAVLIQAGGSLNTVLKTTCFITDMDDFLEFNEIYQTFFCYGISPARSCIQVAGLPKGAKIEIEAVAYCEK